MTDRHVKVWTVIGGMAGAITLAWMILAAFTQNPTQCAHNVAIFLTGPEGKPATGVYVRFPDGNRVEPDGDGVVFAPCWRVGEVASIRDLRTRRQIGEFEVTAVTDRMIHVQVEEAG